MWEQALHQHPGTGCRGDDAPMPFFGK